MRIVCLSNSYKEGGRCLAGVKINDNNQLLIRNNRAVWIRPVCNTPHEEVPNQLAVNINYYDVIQFDNDPNYTRDDYQSENVLIQNNHINVIQRVNMANIMDRLCDNDNFNLIFGNRGKAVHPEIIETLNHSLMMIKVSNFEIIDRTYEGQNYPQIRISFNYNTNNYDLPITDPVFLHQYQLNNNLLDNTENLYLILSLGVLHEGWYSKLVATILY
jgi:hypothetical protein